MPDDTAAIQAVINSAISQGKAYAELPYGTFTCGALTVSGATDLTLLGSPGCTINLIGSPSNPAEYLGIQLINCTRVNVKGVTLVGSGVSADRQAGVWWNSGTLNTIKVDSCSISQTAVGVVADGGQMTGISIVGNAIEDILGTASGYGSGIAVGGYSHATIPFKIERNTLTRCHRHSCYVSGGSNYQVTLNSAIHHRQGETIQGSPLSAFVIARASRVRSLKNSCIDANDTAYSVESDPLSPTPVDDNFLYFNTALNSAGYDLYVGTQSQSSLVFVRRLMAFGNTFTRGAASVYQSIAFLNGKNVTMQSNVIDASAAPANYQAMVLYALGGIDTTNGLSLISNRAIVPSGVSVDWAQSFCDTPGYVRLVENDFNKPMLFDSLPLQMQVVGTA